MQLRHLASFFDWILQQKKWRQRSIFLTLNAVHCFNAQLLLSSCVGTPEQTEDPQPKIQPASIAPPIGPSGVNPGEDRKRGREFLSDSDAESYTYESFSDSSDQSPNAQSRELEFKARTTDKEMIDFEGGSGSIHDQELGEIERELELVPEEQVSQKRPSLALGMQKIKKLYKKRNFDSAIIEVNALLEFYPRSPQLLMMKGTLHQWLGQIDLALASFEQAQFFRPSPKLNAQVKYLRLKVREREQLRSKIKGEVIPGGVEQMEVDVLGFEEDEVSSSRGAKP